jgi:hypothetical protein
MERSIFELGKGNFAQADKGAVAGPEEVVFR